MIACANENQKRSENENCLTNFQYLHENSRITFESTRQSFSKAAIGESVELHLFNPLSVWNGFL